MHKTSLAAVARGCVLLVLALIAAACNGGSAPTGPSTIASPPVVPAPGPTSVTFTVRSGVEGLPLLPDATIRIGSVTRTTGAQGTATFDALQAPAAYEIDVY